MFPYLATFSVSMICVALGQYYSKRSVKSSVFFLFLTCVVLSLLAALRSENIGTDVRTYVIRYFMFARSCPSFMDYIASFAIEYVEPLYMLMCWIVARVTDNVRVWYFIIEFWSMAFIFAFLWENRAKYSIVMGAFAMLMMYYNISFNAVRQMMSVSVCLYSFSAARDRKLKKFIVLMLVATLIHRSSIIMIITYPLCRLLESGSFSKVSIRINILFFCFLGGLIFVNPIVTFLIEIGLFPIKFTHYVGNSFTVERYSAFIFLLPALMIFLLYKKQLFKYDNINPVIYLYLFLWVLFAQLDSVSNQFGRMAYGFLMANIVLYAQVPQITKLSKNKSNGHIIIIGSTFFLLLYWLVSFVIWGVGETFPYMFGTWGD